MKKFKEIREVREEDLNETFPEPILGDGIGDEDLFKIFGDEVGEDAQIPEKD